MEATSVVRIIYLIVRMLISDNLVTYPNLVIAISVYQQVEQELITRNLTDI